ncbi:hypothetical protein F53441_11625 [Fusarium austroafricanum]|uniref:Mannosylphosphorylation protein n=1 Tax=Fusarium austroafricanum TaxID=2364996 RepID=A0A8H4K305_9HYPO|nr:hypothetical protein F53441_11625 [Fusarium austroafricanum]
MRLQTLYAVALGWVTCASALSVPDVLRDLEEKLQDKEPILPKYFKEPTDHSHYDARYFHDALEHEAQNAGIKVLMQTYLATFRDLGIQTWLMHGSLLGWWWGKKVMPWDLDADVSVTEADMHFLAAYYNMTVYYYEYENCPNGCFFQLDVNPYYIHRGRDDELNHIDARWIDMQTGQFIDITAVRYDPGHERGEGVMYDKHDHEFKDKYIFPLLETTFEGLQVKIPYRYKDFLESEYGDGALTRKDYNGRANIEDDSFNLDFNLDIAGLNIAGSTPAAPAPAPPTSSARRISNTSAKRKRLENEPPAAQAQGSERRRSPRSRPADPFDLPDSSKESGAQDTTAESREEEPSLEVEEEPEPELQPEPVSEPQPESELPSPEQDEAQEENEAEIELPVLPNNDASELPTSRPRNRRTSENIRRLTEATQAVRMSDALSSTTRLHTTLLQQEEDVSPSSSPLVRKVRRSEGPTIIRSRLSQRRPSRLAERDDEADELSPDRLDHAPADDEQSDDDATVDAEPEVEQIDEQTAAEEEQAQQEQEELAQEEEEAVAEAIGAVEAAKTIGRKRPRRSLPSQSPVAEPEVQEEGEEPAAKRRRGRPSRSPATQKQPATKPKTTSKSKSRTTGEKPLPKQVRKTKQAAKERRVSDGSAIEITVQRFVNVKKFSKGDDEEDQLAADVPFTTSGETVVDVFLQVCLEVIEGTVAKLLETLNSTEDKDKKKECRIKIRALEAYKEELNSRLLQLAIHLSDWQSLRKRVRVVQREKLSLREEILRLKAEREQVALKMDAVRIKHEEDTKESKYRLDTSAVMHDIDMAVERGRDAPELSRAQEKKAEIANLELLVAKITDEASSASSAGGMLQQVKNFNAFLERAAIALESR